MACVLKIKSTTFVSKRLSEKLGKLWIAAEVILFVLVGAAVDIRYTLEAGVAAIIMIFVALIFRAAGVLICMLGTQLTWKERLFCVIAYLPKATVQAGNRFCTFSCRTFLWKNSFISCGNGNNNNRTAWSFWNGYQLQKNSGA